MIVYNVKRRFFTMKNDADAYRKAGGFKPDALLKVVVTDRDQLAALLNALCEPTPGNVAALPVDVAPARIVDDAYVPAETDVPDCVPAFLRESWAKHAG